MANKYHQQKMERLTKSAVKTGEGVLDRMGNKGTLGTNAISDELGHTGGGVQRGSTQRRIKRVKKLIKELRELKN